MDILEGSQEIDRHHSVETTCPSLTLKMFSISPQSHLTSCLYRYPLAVTKYRESERYSSSLYNQNDPWDPPVVFEEFLQNNENIEEEVLTPFPPLPTSGPVVLEV